MALLSTIRDLHRRKGRDRRGLALAEGVRLVEEMLAADAPCKGAVIAPALLLTPRGLALPSALVEHGVAITEVSDEELVELAATEHPQGIVAVYAPREWTFDNITAAPNRPIIVLDGVQDPGNVGTIARTALAFGAAGLIALPGTVDLANPKVVRAAMGALFRLPALHCDIAPLITWLGNTDVALWATAVDGETLGGAPPDPIAIALGNEGAGLSAELLAHAARRVSIPIHPVAESLNVAAAAAILLYQVTRCT
jgi:TrmH family RNA methyltransferase